MIQDNLYASIRKLIEKQIEEHRELGIFNYVEGKNGVVNVPNEFANLKNRIKELENKKADKTELTDLENRIASKILNDAEFKIIVNNLECQLKADRMREMKAFLKILNDNKLEKIYIQNGYVDTFKDFAGVDKNRSIGINQVEIAGNKYIKSELFDINNIGLQFENPIDISSVSEFSQIFMYRIRDINRGMMFSYEDSSIKLYENGQITKTFNIKDNGSIMYIKFIEHMYAVAVVFKDTTENKMYVRFLNLNLDKFEDKNIDINFKYEKADFSYNSTTKELVLLSNAGMLFINTLDFKSKEEINYKITYDFGTFVCLNNSYFYVLGDKGQVLKLNQTNKVWEVINANNTVKMMKEFYIEINNYVVFYKDNNLYLFDGCNFYTAIITNKPTKNLTLLGINKINNQMRLIFWQYGDKVYESINIDNFYNSESNLYFEEIVDKASIITTYIKTNAIENIEIYISKDEVNWLKIENEKEIDISSLTGDCIYTKIKFLKNAEIYGIAQYWA